MSRQLATTIWVAMAFIGCGHQGGGDGGVPSTPTTGSSTMFCSFKCTTNLTVDGSKTSCSVGTTDYGFGFTNSKPISSIPSSYKIPQDGDACPCSLSVQSNPYCDLKFSPST